MESGETIEEQSKEQSEEQSKEQSEEQVKEEQKAKEDAEKNTEIKAEELSQPKEEPVDCAVFVNGDVIVLRGKPQYVFIDVFDYIDFDLSDSRGRAIITKINDKDAFYTQTLNEGDEIVIRWSEG